MTQKPPPEWLERVKATNKFHLSKVKAWSLESKKWTIKDTARELNRAVGPVSEELKVASWLKSHEAILMEFEFFHEAIEYIRARKHKLLLEEASDD